MRHVRTLLVSAALLLPLRPAEACLWDSDTLKEESLNHKDVADVVRGRILKHSTAFYEKKLAYTLPLLERPDASPDTASLQPGRYSPVGVRPA